MGTQITHKAFNIDFQVDDISQGELEIYEHTLGEYIEESGTDGEIEAFVSSAIVLGALDTGWIPEDVIPSVAKASPKVISFLSKKIAEMVRSLRSIPDGFELDFEIPEITQGMLEKYELEKRKIIGDTVMTDYESAVAFAFMVKIGLVMDWIPESIITADEIAGSEPHKINYIANKVTEALIDCRDVSGE